MQTHKSSASQKEDIENWTTQLDASGKADMVDIKTKPTVLQLCEAINTCCRNIPHSTKP